MSLRATATCLSASTRGSDSCSVMTRGTPRVAKHDLRRVRARWRMRIATFNILSPRSPPDDQGDQGPFADAGRRIDADLLGMQEVERNQPRSKHSDLTAVAADAMGAREHRFVGGLSGTPGATWEAATG